LFGTPIPTVALQHAGWHGGHRWYDGAATALLQIHTVAPPIVAYLLWLRRRALFFRFAAALLVLSFAAALTFLAFPTAPPWAASAAGYIGHVAQLPIAHPVAGSVPAVSTSPWSAIVPANPDAAIPSLHAGYAFFLALFVAGLALRWRSRLRYPAIAACAIYPLLQTLTVLYTGNHYVVDVLFGFAYAAGALWVVNRVWRSVQLPW
jgi:membrane-associated phospholipid phosphatase